MDTRRTFRLPLRVCYLDECHERDAVVIGDHVRVESLAEAQDGFE
jgi:hypothetical protein